MTIERIRDGNQLVQLRYLIDKNFQSILATLNDPEQIIDPASIRRIGSGVFLGELRRSLNHNFSELDELLGPITGLNVSLGSGDSLTRVREISDDNFILVGGNLDVTPDLEMLEMLDTLEMPDDLEMIE